MKRLAKKALSLLLILYVVLTMWIVYRKFSDPNTDSYDKHKILGQSEYKQTFNGSSEISHVDIWGKAAIAEYFWGHIFEETLIQKPNFLLWEGSVTLNSLHLSYTSGAYLVPVTAKKEVQNLVIILNGREEGKIKKSKIWLDSLTDEKIFPHLQNLGIILLGNEYCDNDWILHYLNLFRKLIKFVLIVYDVMETDHLPISQWPLGVATYRNFPFIAKHEVDIYSKRKYKCNFLGTVYEKSSRILLNEILQKNIPSYHCFVKARYTWEPKETDASTLLYHSVLKQSDLTLCPVGMNSESYRIYEAMSYGSIPVLEDVMTPGKCGTSFASNKNIEAPFKLLKEYNAPVIYVKDWSQLADIMEKEFAMTDQELVKRRQQMLEWYSVFRYKMRVKVVQEILSTFT